MNQSITRDFGSGGVQLTNNKADRIGWTGHKYDGTDSWTTKVPWSLVNLQLPPVPATIEAENMRRGHGRRPGSALGDTAKTAQE